MPPFPSRFLRTRRAKRLRPVLKGWMKANEKYIKQHAMLDQNDCSWWYIERASISALAAGAWLSGSVALEEFSLEKGLGKEASSGRCDLCIHVDNEFFSFEAKQAWCGIGSTAENGVREAKAKLKSAIDEARRLPSHMNRRFGLCFAVPHLPEKDEDHIDALLSKWTRQLVESREYDILAWFFPQVTRKLCSEQDGRFYPGVVLLAKEIHRGK